MKKVSIVVPVYNAEEYLKECLDSLLKQTYHNLEIICVDDGSTDGSVDIIKVYQEEDNRIRLIQQTNQYAGVARNNGMKNATGEYICFLDADDYFDSELIEKTLKAAMKSDADIVLCDGYSYNNITGEMGEPAFILNKSILKNCQEIFSYKDFPERIFSVGGSIPWNKLFKREFIDKHGLQFQNIQRCNDEYFVDLAMVLAEKIVSVNERLVTYRINNVKSLQGYGDNKLSYDFYEAYKAIKKKLIEINKYEAVKVGLANKILTSCIFLLRKQRRFQNYIVLYDFIKHTVFEELDVYKLEKEEIFAYRDNLEKIKELDVCQYMFEELVLLRESGGEIYLFPYKETGNVRKIAIYGAGEVGKSYYKQIIDCKRYSIVGWYDRDYQKFQNKGYDIKDSEDVGSIYFDKIVIAVNDNRIKAEIKDFMINKGISEDKIVL